MVVEAVFGMEISADPEVISALDEKEVIVASPGLGGGEPLDPLH